MMALSRWQTPYLPYDYTQVTCHKGKGPAIVLVPGLGAQSKVFQPLSDELKGNARALVDPPGFGNRNPKEAGVSLETSAKLAVSSGYLPDGPKLYVGWSAGSMAAIEMAKCDPDAIGIVLVNGLFDDLGKLFRQPLRYVWRYPLKAATMGALLYYLTGYLPKTVLKRLERPGSLLSGMFWPMVRRPRKLSAEGRRALVRYNRCKSAWKHLKANLRYQFTAESARTLNVPVLVVAGEHDPLDTWHSKSEFLQGCLRHKVITIDAAHCVPLEAPAALARCLLEFRDSLM